VAALASIAWLLVSLLAPSWANGARRAA